VGGAALALNGGVYTLSQSPAVGSPLAAACAPEFASLLPGDPAIRLTATKASLMKQ
jgi:hypothetical protein